MTRQNVITRSSEMRIGLLQRSERATDGRGQMSAAETAVYEKLR